MHQTNTLPDKILFYIPRLILFSIIIFSLVVTLIISLDALAFLRPPLFALRHSIVSWLSM